MSGPRVDNLIYEFAFPDPQFTVAADAPPTEFTLGDFDCRCEALQLIARPRTIFPSVDEARAALDPFLRDWEVELELGRGHRIEFRFSGGSVLDVERRGDAKVHAVSVLATVGVSASVTITMQSHPGPPTGQLAASPLVDMLLSRLRGAAQGREPVPSAAYVVLTSIQFAFGGTDETAAAALAVSRNLLGKVRQLASRHDPIHGRKASRQAVQPLTPEELGWLGEAIRLLVRRVAEVAAEAPELPVLTLDDLPDLPK